MENATEAAARTGYTLYVAAGDTAASAAPDARLLELRGEAMRRLFPKSGAGPGRLEGRLAPPLYAYLADAASVADFERRLGSIARYPVELVEEIGLRDGRTVFVRPVLPSDAALQRDFVRSLSPATRRNRFHGGVADLPMAMLRYMTEVDHVDHLALVGEVPAVSGPRHVAEARWVRRDDAREHADFAIAIADDYQHSGLGNALLDHLERSARAKGISRLHGQVLHTNRRMRGWLEARGWIVEDDPLDRSVLSAERSLRAGRMAEPADAWREAA